MEKVLSTASSEVYASPNSRTVIIASMLGTIFEWYDFYLYGALAAVVGRVFFSGVSPLQQYVFGLLAFGTGFVVRPLGALLFGRLGDRIGRKYTFLATILIMGLSTFSVGLLPGRAEIGEWAPVLLIALRMLQGLAIGGEYGGAAVFVAEHAPREHRGGFTSWLQTAFILGLCLSLLVILGCRLSMSSENFDRWGWRIPFLASLVLLALSLWIRLRLHESPVFARMKAAGLVSRSPLRDSFLDWYNVKMILIVLFGLQAGQAVITIGGPIYVMLFMINTLHVEPVTATLVTVIGLLAGTPFYVLSGYLSDRIGRKPLIMTSLVLGALTLFPAYRLLIHFANPTLEKAQRDAPVTVIASPDECSYQFNPTGNAKLASSCDVARLALIKRGIPYTNANSQRDTLARVRIGDQQIDSYPSNAADVIERTRVFNQTLDNSLAKAGYPASGPVTEINYVGIVALILYLQFVTGLSFGPMAATLVELFPTRIRYSSISLPYHIGNGWIGGLLPATMVSIQAITGGLLSGLAYPVSIAALSVLVCIFFVPETKGRSLEENSS